ncbi:MAG: hypothetical protein NZ949_06615, partial [Candidatus Kapabacteria bacterium]|nr:hypothetical protein [Candidatus Kapabacteria bacterium]
MRRNAVWVAFVLSAVAPVVVLAQVAYTVRGALLQNWHRAELRDAGGIIDCGVFRSGTGNGWGAAIGLDLPLSPLHGELAFLLSNRSATLLAHSAFPIRDTLTGEVIEIATEARLQSTWLMMELQPAVLLPFGRRFRAFIAPRIGMPLVARFRQEEHIRSPDTVFFALADGRRLRSRLLAEGTVQERAQFLFGASAGIEHVLSLGGAWQWVQRIGVEYTLTNLIPRVEWRALSIRGEMGIRVGARHTTEPSPPLVPEPPPIVPSPTFPQPTLSLRPVGLDVRVRVGQELLATPPVVPAVFFEQNSAQIPEHYVLHRVDAETLLTLDPLELHRCVLPYVAWIVRRNPAARVVLEGATSGEDDEPGGLALARQRVEAVRQALVDLGVPNEVIVVRWALLPRAPSNPTYVEGRAENRRVDIVLLNAPT